MRTTIELSDSELRNLVMEAARKAAPHIPNSAGKADVNFATDRGMTVASVTFLHEAPKPPSGDFRDR